MKIRASKKYIEGVDKLVKVAQRFAEDMVTLPENKEVDQRFVKFSVDMWRAVDLLADGEGNSGAFVDDDKTGES